MFTDDTKIQMIISDCNLMPHYKYNMVKFEDVRNYINQDSALNGNSPFN